MFAAPTQVAGPTFSIGLNCISTAILKLHVAKGVHLNAEAPNKYELKTTNSSIIKIHDGPKADLAKGEDIEVKFEKIIEGEAKIIIEATLFVCNDNGMCTRKQVDFEFNVADGSEQNPAKTFKYNLTFD